MFLEERNVSETETLACVDTMLFPWCANATSTLFHTELLTVIETWHACERAKEEQQILLAERNELLRFFGKYITPIVWRVKFDLFTIPLVSLSDKTAARNSKDRLQFIVPEWH